MMTAGVHSIFGAAGGFSIAITAPLRAGTPSSSSELPHDGPAADGAQGAAVEVPGPAAVVTQDEDRVAGDEDFRVIVAGLLVRSHARGGTLPVHEDLTFDHLDAVSGETDDAGGDFPLPLAAGHFAAVGDDIFTIELVGLVHPGVDQGVLLGREGRHHLPLHPAAPHGVEDPEASPEEDKRNQDLDVPSDELDGHGRKSSLVRALPLSRLNASDAEVRTVSAGKLAPTVVSPTEATGFRRRFDRRDKPLL